jgi:Cytochrome P450
MGGPIMRSLSKKRRQCSTLVRMADFLFLTWNLIESRVSAGSETTIAVLYFLFLSLAIHPDAQKKAQKELDDLLVGQDGHIRLPEAADAAQLPYVRALVKEVLR